MLYCPKTIVQSRARWQIILTGTPSELSYVDELLQMFEDSSGIFFLPAAISV